MVSRSLHNRYLRMPYTCFVLFLILTLGCSVESLATCTGEPVAHYLGAYRVESVEQHRGGLTRKEQAQQRVGKTVIINTEQLATDFALIEHPRYVVSCYSNAAEGDVPSQRWSTFYGLGVERDSIDVLKVFATGDAGDEPSYYFEIVPGGLWELFDGWVYYLIKEPLTN